ncbi:lactate racemase domain-containing protein [Halorientalis regularis]|uniref:Nickel-dependent lactate racemase n=1 Tax=Halorientalis regularis TaxID=660518 RepID=A0A1G7MVG5_9EURY|nr:lactate racemase domain-containing protein [Halorientalis regularis]SDF65734.1 Nickel-dependent lactate racemase [Halorientalis regularis]
MPFTLPLGDSEVSVSLPDCDVTVAEPPGGEAVDVRAAAERAVADPHGSELARLADPDDLVTLVVTDVTRATPDDVLVDVLLSELRRAGVAREQVTVLLGLGLHRPMTDDEIEAGLGDHADLATNHDPAETVQVGTVDDCPVEVHECVAEADLVVSTGMVEPHQYAGFSGGAKTVAIGAGSESLIRYTHGPEMLANEGVRLGRVEGNPFRAAVDRAGDEIGLDFCLNVTHGPSGFLGASAGDTRNVVRDLAAVGREALSVPVSRDYDAVIAGVGAPKDANLYQTTRAATYVVLGDRNPLRESGRVVIPAAIPEGAGAGTGERRFYDRLSGAESAAALYDEMRTGYEPGAQRAFVVARTLRDHDVYVTDSQHPEIVEDCLLHARDSVADAVDPGSDVLVVPDALDTLLVESGN